MISPAARRRRYVQCAIDVLETRRLLAADLVISEFVASNSNGLADNFGERSDWIEIHNRGDAPANLGDYYLTDSISQPARWRFPQQSLAAGAYLVVFASDRNLSVAGQPLHTNFKLGAGGEYLGLMKGDGTAQFAYAPEFPAQTTDVSYGLTNENDPGSALQFFAVPTPGSVNVASAAAPVFSVPGGLMNTSRTITLTSATPGAQIRYTTDGSIPTTSSTFYNGPLTFGITTRIRARAFATGYNASPVVTERYIRVDAGAANVDNNIGTVVIDTHGQGMNDTSYISATGTFISNAGTGRSSMNKAPDYHGNIGIRLRGSTSQDSPKKSYAVELWDEANQDRDASLLGMPAESDWVLYGSYMEKSLMQNALAFGWGQEAGLLAPRLRYVEVYVNNDGGSFVNYTSDYVGLYILMEKIKIGDDRVDIANLDSGDNAEPDVTGGYLWKKDRIEPDEQVITTSTGQPFVMVDPEALTSQQTTWLTNHLNSFEGALYGANYRDPVNGYAKYIDVDNWIDTWLMVEMTKQIDGFRLSSFFYKDRGGKIKTGPMWDYNISLGNASYYNGNEPTNFYTDDTFFSDFEFPYIRRLLSDPAYKQRVVDRWAELRKSDFATPQLMADIDARVAEITDNTGNYPIGAVPTQASNNAVVRNFKKWNTLGSWNWPNAFYDRNGIWINDVKFMKDWLSARVSWMDSVLLPAPVASKPSGTSGPTTVTLTPNRVVNNNVSLVNAATPVKAIVPSGEIANWRERNFNASGWLSSTVAGVNGVGYDLNTAGVNYNPLIGVNIASMQGNRLGVYTRYEFNLTNPAAIESLVLRLRYDDGFVAYLNGTQIAWDNVQNSGEVFDNVFNTGWDYPARGARDDNLAINVREFDVSALKSMLVVGTNVLAIHVMNNVNTSSDLLLVPELVSRTRVAASAGAGTQIYYTTDGSDPLLADGVTRNPNALLYTGPIAINASAQITYRSVTGGTWSAIDERTFTIDNAAPTVTTATYHWDASATSVTVQFNEDVAFANGVSLAAQLTHLDSGGTITLTSSAYDPATRTATFNLPSALADGQYRLTLLADQIADAAGNALDGDADGSAGDDGSFDFFILAGDVNHDGSVNFTDLLTLAQNYGTAGKSISQGNVDGSADGSVNFADLLILAQRYGTTLPTAPAFAAAATQSTTAKRRSAISLLTD